ncbi:unnamed protein product [Allacma fusca]|uniref:Uncharacterized protein n=1 Tax=Allacma fusca TaxID=39272 RepID=A0A8J2PCN8_9HEXA|nr:unnamed protein product [Allacma fusca]
MINKFKGLVARTSRRLGSSLGICNPPELPQEPVDPVIAELNPLLSRIAALKKEAETYCSNHINQDFRSIDAELNLLLTKLDSAKVPEDRLDARDLRRQGYRENEAAVQFLWKGIHDNDVTQCELCLPLG